MLVGSWFCCEVVTNVFYKVEAKRNNLDCEICQNLLILHIKAYKLIFSADLESVGNFLCNTTSPFTG